MKIYRKRIFIIYLLMAICGMAILVRLGYIKLIKNDEYYHPKPNGEFEKALGIQYRRLLKAQRQPRS